jgi:hypothetical protein
MTKREKLKQRYENKMHHGGEVEDWTWMKREQH